VSNRCVNTFVDAHDHAPVSSVMFSKNAKYVLSAGRDSKARLWELSTGTWGWFTITVATEGQLLLLEYQSQVTDVDLMKK